MKDKMEKPGDATTPPGQSDKSSNVNHIISHQNESLPVIYLPMFVWVRLTRIAKTMGLPTNFLGEVAVTRWVLLNWNFKKDRPLKGNKK